MSGHHTHATNTTRRISALLATPDPVMAISHSRAIMISSRYTRVMKHYDMKHRPCISSASKMKVPKVTHHGIASDGAENTHRGRRHMNADGRLI